MNSPLHRSGLVLAVISFLIADGEGAPGDVKWTYQTAGAIRSSPALGTNGLVYFASMEGRVCAADATTGANRWQYFSGEPFYSSPAIANNGAVIIADKYSLYALNGTNGSKLWSFSNGYELYSSPAVGTNGLVYLNAWNGTLYAINVTNGALQWEFYMPEVRQTFASPSIGGNGVVYFGGGWAPSWTGASNFFALDARTGAELWSFRSVNMIQSTPAIGADGTVYIPSYDKFLYAFDGQTGTQKWSQRLGDSISSSPAIGPDGGIYLGSNDGRLYALNANDGSEKWNFLCGDTIHSSPALGADGTVYFGSYDKKVYALDARTGALKWSYTTGDLVLSSPAIGNDGTVYIGSMDGKLYAFEGSAAPAISAWPSFKGGLQRSGSAVEELDLASSRLTRLSIKDSHANVTIRTKVGRIHHLEAKRSLDDGDWQEVLTFTGTGWDETIRDPQPTADQFFYRVRTEQ